MPLKILSYGELYGWTMDTIVSQVGRKNNCTFCGVFRRQALDRGAAMLNVDHIVTGHNADDIAETVLMNSMLHPLFLVNPTWRTFDSYARRYREAWTLHFNLHSGRRYYPSIKAFQVCLWKGDCDVRFLRLSTTSCVNSRPFVCIRTQVCIFQKARLLLHRVYLLARCLSRPCSWVPQGSRSCKA